MLRAYREHASKRINFLAAAPKLAAPMLVDDALVSYSTPLASRKALATVPLMAKLGVKKKVSGTNN